ncbi:MAG: hypothetical protein GWN58_63500 [Anaerolineae bacterium]|nr:hypothetical protein [Anaerolineae bacterium]
MASDLADQPADLATANAPTQPQPDPVSPVGYASLVGIFGFAGGMVLTPWLEKLYKRFRDE